MHNVFDSAVQNIDGIREGFFHENTILLHSNILREIKYKHIGPKGLSFSNHYQQCPKNN